jgi:hypothetical protein
LIAWGLIMGRATAGDWESVAGTMRDYAFLGAPALALLVAAVAIELRLQPSRARPAPPLGAGFAPAAGYLLVAAGWVLWLGKP